VSEDKKASSTTHYTDEHSRVVKESSEMEIDITQKDRHLVLRNMLKHFLLRRVKSDVDTGLLPKINETVNCKLTASHAASYEQLKQQIKTNAKSAAAAKTKTKGKGKGKEKAKTTGSASAEGDAEDDRPAVSGNAMMEIRKEANSPLLRRNLYTQEKVGQMRDVVVAHLQQYVRKLQEEEEQEDKKDMEEAKLKKEQAKNKPQYTAFMQNMRPKLVEENPGMGNEGVMKLVGELWQQEKAKHDAAGSDTGDTNAEVDKNEADVGDCNSDDDLDEMTVPGE
jgi:hypothetical protein